MSVKGSTLGPNSQLSVFTASRLTGYSCRMLTHLIERGELLATRKGQRSWAIRFQDLHQCLNRRLRQGKVRNSVALSLLLRYMTPSRNGKKVELLRLTYKSDSTIYSTRPKAGLKGETTYAESQTWIEVHQ
jgi:hypothetical protein